MILPPTTEDIAEAATTIETGTFVDTAGPPDNPTKPVLVPKSPHAWLRELFMAHHRHTAPPPKRRHGTSAKAWAAVFGNGRIRGRQRLHPARGPMSINAKADAMVLARDHKWNEAADMIQFENPRLADAWIKQKRR